MNVKIVMIGNSRGIRLPKPLLEQIGFPDEVELEARDGQLVISPVVKVRSGWAEAAETLAGRGEDAPLDPYLATEFDEEEWEW